MRINRYKDLKDLHLANFLYGYQIESGKFLVNLCMSIILIILLLIPIKPSFALIETDQPRIESNRSDLPEALSEDDSFGDLPFEQLRQALREEVERGPKHNIPKYSERKYNLFIR